MTNHPPKLPNTFFRFMWFFLSQHPWIVSLHILLSLAAGLWGPFNNILIKNIINLLPSVQPNHSAALFTPIGLIVGNFIIFDNLTWRLITLLRAKYAPRILSKIISTSMHYVLWHAHQFFHENLSGKLAKQITNLADGAKVLISTVSAELLRGLSLIIASCITAYFVNPMFCILLTSWLGFFILTSILMSKKFIALSDAQADAESAVVGELVDTVSNHNNVRIFSRKHYEDSHMESFLCHMRSTYSRTHYYAVIMHCIQGAMIAIMLGLSGYLLVKLYAKSLVSIGDFALIFGLATQTGHTTWKTMVKIDELNKAIGKCKNALLILMDTIAITDKADAKLLKCPQGKIQFKDVSFHYKNKQPLYQHMSVTIEAGQKVGLVGYSGAGKSSFLNLILRLFDIDEGTITIDGQNIQDVTQDSLHEKIGIIPQEPILFQRSLMENIRYGRIDATDEEVIAAAKKANAHEFIMSRSKGYHTLVGERGIKLSGGQRQRIAIARAILKNAPILILDEATSQLDAVTEALIQSSLRELMKNKTTLVIAYRLSTLLDMDRLLVFDNGNIVGDGPQHTLLTQCTHFKKLWDAQVGGIIEDNPQPPEA